MIITKEIEGFNIESSTIDVNLYVAEDYNSEYHWGDEFGYLYIWNA